MDTNDLKNKLELSQKYLLGLSTKEIFAAQSSLDLHQEKSERDIQVTFPGAFLLHSISHWAIPDKLAKKTEKLKISLQKSLIKESQGLSFNYFTRKFLKRSGTKAVLPDDLDDTALILQSLLLTGLNVSPEYFLNITLLEEKPGGPYKTWFGVEDEKWADIDPFVNANFLYLAASYGLKMPNTEKYLVKMIKQNRFHSKYYESDLFGWLYLCRFLSVSSQPNLKKLAEKYLAGLSDKKYKTFDDIEILLFSLCKLYIGLELPKDLLSKIFQMQQGDGCLSSGTFCRDYAFEGKTTYTGSKVLTTSLFTEILSLLLKAPRKTEKSDDVTKPLVTYIDAYLQKQVYGKKFLKQYPPKEFLKPLNILLLLTSQIVNDLEKKHIDLLQSTSLVLYFGWLGYTLVDDTLDKQNNDLDPIVIPIAIREHVMLVHKTFPENFLEIQKAWEISEMNYMKEVKNTHIPRSSSLRINSTQTRYIRQRMSAFLEIIRIFIQQMLEMEKKHKNSSEKLSQDIKDILEDIIVLDQVNDNAHDWQEDMELGIDTEVTRHLRHALSVAKSPGTRDDMSDIFWNTTMPALSNYALNLSKKTQKAIAKLPVKMPGLEKLLKAKLSPFLEAEKQKNEIKGMSKFYNK